MGLWKISYMGKDRCGLCYHITHHNFLKGENLEDIGSSKLLYSPRFYHRQRDIFEVFSFREAFEYIERHDRFRATEKSINGDINRLKNELPHRTARQKKNLNGAIYRAKKMAIKNVYALFNELDRGKNKDCEDIER